jgi:hypothetical protein
MGQFRVLRKLTVANANGLTKMIRTLSSALDNRESGCKRSEKGKLMRFYGMEKKESDLAILLVCGLPVERLLRLPLISPANVGSASRHNYTVIGNEVNLTSRPQRLTKQQTFETSTICSGATRSALQGAYTLRDLGNRNPRQEGEASHLGCRFRISKSSLSRKCEELS